MTEKSREYNPQPAYNEFLVPTNPPPYSEAVSTASPYNPVCAVYPPPPEQYNHLPVVPAVPSVPSVPPVPPVPHVTYINTAPPVCVGPNSCAVTCPNCKSSIKTVTKKTSQKSAHICCFLLFLCGCCLCSCIPYCMKSFQNISHYCPNCNGFVGLYKG